MTGKRMRYGVASGIMAVALAVGSVAWACTPPNGQTQIEAGNCIPDSIGRCQYTRGTSASSLVKARAINTFSHVGYDNNWKLFIGVAGMWCMSGNPLYQLDSTTYSYNATGVIPDLTQPPAQGSVPSTWPLGGADVCMNNGDGGGDTANPVAVVIVRKVV